MKRGAAVLLATAMTFSMMFNVNAENYDESTMIFADGDAELTMSQMDLEEQTNEESHEERSTSDSEQEPSISVETEVPSENSLTTLTSTSDCVLPSPDGSIVVSFFLDSEGRMSYTVKKNNDTVLESSRLGIITDKEDFSQGISIESTSVSSYDETYSLPQGKKSNYRDHFNQREIVIVKGNNICKIYFRAYDDGIAFRYYLPGEGAATITAESSQFNLPDNTGGWAFDWRSDYEGLYTYRTPSEFSNANFAMPVLASVSDNKYWILLTEGNVYNSDGSYCASHLDGADGEVMSIAFAPEQTDPITTTYPFQTPYRVAIITDNLNDLANSTLVTNLNPPSTMKDTSWINTGKSAWSWWSEERSPQWFERQRDYVDFAAKNGWDFVTVDAGWDDSWVAQLCAEANDKGIGIVIWTDVDAIDARDEINEKLSKWASWGVAGIKVDFMMNDSQTRMETYQLIAEKAGELHMLVNFHGSTKPSGEIRTWPHVTTSEAVRGSEHYKWSEYSTAYQNAVLPFTRNVIGPMDFTPTVISNSNLNTTHAHQLALSVIFESGMQHFADSIDSYEMWKGKNFLNRVPVSWDETKVLDAFPGNYVVMARRKGDDWYVGAVTSDARTININCDFLTSNVYHAYIYKDTDEATIMQVEELSVNTSDTISVNLASTGGCAILFTQSEYSTEIVDNPQYKYYEAESQENTFSGQASVVDDRNCSGNKKVGNLGGSAESSVTFKQIEAETDGAYRVQIVYASGDKRKLKLWINDADEQLLDLPGTGSYHTLRCTYVDVQLRKGINTITFGGTEYAPDIDRIGIMECSSVGITRIEVESGNLSGGAKISDGAACSGGKKVGYIGKGGEVTLNNINVNQSGKYLVRIYYSTGDNRTLMISANDNPAMSVICFDSGSFDALEYKEILLDLTAGENSIRLFNSIGYAPDLDCITISSAPIV